MGDDGSLLVGSFEQTNQALTVMTYNLLGSRLNKVPWTTRSGYVTRLIRAANPDIIGFQENFSYRKGAQAAGSAARIGDN